MNRSVGTSEAIRLAQASDWKSLQRLLERDPASATYRGDHGMLPLHWACTVRHVPLSLIAKLLQAYPESVATKNDGDLLPLQIAIRAGVQAACLRKLVRAYPEAVSEQMPDGGTALEMAEANGLEADKLKVLYRAYDRSSIILQQQQKELDVDDDNEDEGDLSERKSEGVLDLNRVTSEQGEGEASGVERVLKDEDAENDVGGWTEAAGLEPFVGNVSFNRGFLPDDEEEQRASDTGAGSTVEPRDSISMMSEQSLSDMDGLDTLHDQLVSPSSISTGSRDDMMGTSHSGRSSFGATQVCSGSHRGSPLRGFQKWSHEHSPLQQRHTTSSLSGQFQRDGFASDRGQRILSSAMRADAGGRNARGEEDDEVGGRRRGHSRHSSLPVMLNHERVRHDGHSGFHNEADDDVEHVGKDNGSPRDSISPGGGVVCAQVNLQDRLFHSVREFPRCSMPRTGSQRSSPPFFQSRASHGSINDRGHNDLRPEWKHDDECSICRASFGMFKHRHHCRNCGKSICSQHSADKKISMEAKGFTTPQRVCVTCYAMITHSRGRKHELEQAETNRGNDSLLGVHPHQHIALGAGDDDRNGVRGASFPSATVAIPGRGFARENSQSPTISNGSLDASPTTGTHEWSYQKSSVIAAGEATGGTGERVTVSNDAPRQKGSSSSSPYSSSSAVHELRSLLASQQKQIQQLAQSNLQMQQQLLEHDHVKTETMRFLNQLMTRVSILELQTDCNARINKRRSAETGESEDDEEFPHDEDHK